MCKRKRDETYLYGGGDCEQPEQSQEPKQCPEETSCAHEAAGNCDREDRPGTKTTNSGHREDGPEETSCAHEPATATEKTDPRQRRRTPATEKTGPSDREDIDPSHK